MNILANRVAVFALLMAARPAVGFSSVNVLAALATLPKIHINQYTIVRFHSETLDRYTLFALVMMAQPTQLGFSWGFFDCNNNATSCTR